MDEINLTINGKKIVCRAGTTVFNAAKENDIRIPSLCHHPHLEPIGACRLCLVEDENGRILASCVTPVSENLSVQTDSPNVRAHRKNIIRLLMANHPESCIVCNKGNRCELRKIASQLGVGTYDLYPMPHYTGFEEANPFIIRDLSKCILCGKCIRADHELVGVGAIDYNQRGFRSRPATVHDRPLEQSSCTFCGSCISICPTGALAVKNVSFAGSPQKEMASICGFCGVGCSLVMGIQDNRIVDVNPSPVENSINQSTLCVRGHFAHDFLSSSQRLTTPLLRKNGELSPATWEEAFAVVTDKLFSIKKKNGPQSIAFFGSSKCSLEENYLFQKIARVILQTNHIDNGGFLTGRSVLNRFQSRLGGMSIGPLKDLEKAEVVLVLGADPTHSLPVLGYHLKRVSKIKGVPIIVADPRRTDLIPFASLWMPLATQTDYYLINGLAALLYHRKAYDAQFVKRFTQGSDEYFKELSVMNLDQISRVTEIEPEGLEKAADLLAGKKIVFVVGHGILQQRNGLEVIDALLNLALMTGSLGQRGTGFYFLTMENNALGAWDMGAVPDFLPGRQSLVDNEIRKYWDRAWKIKISPDPGLNIIKMIEAAEEGNLKAMYIMGENPLRSLPQPGQIRKAFDNLEFLVVQDILDSETVRMADVVLPGAAFSEKAGSFTNLEGRIQSFDPVVSPPGQAKPDWEILSFLGNQMGLPAQYRTIEKIRDEIRELAPLYSQWGKNGNSSWIKEKSDLALFHPDESGESALFSPLVPLKENIRDEDFPFKAILGSWRYHLGSGTRTGSSNRINQMPLSGEIEVSIKDGERLHLLDGDKIRLSSSYGSIERKVKVVRNQKPGLIFVPRAFYENDARNLLPLTTLEAPNSPGFKEINVKIEKT